MLLHSPLEFSETQTRIFGRMESAHCQELAQQNYYSTTTDMNEKLTQEYVTFPPHLGASSGCKITRLNTSSALASTEDFKQEQLHQ